MPNRALIAGLLIACAGILAAYFAHTHVDRGPKAAGEHASMYFYSNSDFFAASLKPFASTEPLSEHPRVFITNQHVLAASLIARQFALSRDPSVRRVFLITQNNWSAGRAPVITSRFAWRTPLGDIQPDIQAADLLIAAGVAQADESIFDQEHGITGIVPYVAYAFPNAKIIPLVIRDGTQDSMVDALAQKIGAFGQDTVVVGTIDMSHYLPKPMADEHDRAAQDAIRSFDYAALPRLDIDTAPTLRAVLKVALAKGLGGFTKTGAANSADITGDSSLTSTTGYLTGYFAPGAPAPRAAVRTLFVGDIMLDRTVADRADSVGAHGLVADIERLFLGADMNIANLEGTITNEASLSRKDHGTLRFTFSPGLAADILKALNIDMASLANNHALDFGPTGYDRTREALSGDNVLAFGHPLNAPGLLSAKKDVGGKTVCLVGYMQLFSPGTSAVVEEIAALRPGCYKLAVFPHWGEEYRLEPTEAQRAAAHAFIDAGADLVVGAHPHVVEPLEIYKGRIILYSLGNFIFDQDFSWATRHGLAVSAAFGADGTRLTFMPVAIAGGVVSPAAKPDADRVLARLVDSALAPDLAHDILTASTVLIPN